MAWGEVAAVFALWVWNGPFHVGQLTRPVSVGDVILKMLETLWRALVLIVVVPIIVLLIVVIWQYIVDPTFFPPLKNKIEATARWDDGVAPIVTIGSGQKPFRCSKEYPLKVEFYNRSRRIVRDTSFSVVANLPNRSTNVFEHYFSAHLDAVMQPQSGWTQCYAIQLQSGIDPSSVEYKVTIDAVSE